MKSTTNMCEGLVTQKAAAAQHRMNKMVSVIALAEAKRNGGIRFGMSASFPDHMNTSHDQPHDLCARSTASAPICYGGTINRSGTLLVRAQKVGRDSMLARLIQMVAEAQRSCAPIQRLAGHVAPWFVPLVIAVALAAFAPWVI